MQKFWPGAPYFYFCKSCGHRFQRSVKWALFCPKCKSLRIIVDPTVQK